MRVSAAVVLGTAVLWIASSTNPVRAGTVRSSGITSLTPAALNNQDYGSLVSSRPFVFDPASGSYVFETAASDRVVLADPSCKDGAPDGIRGTGGSGSKRRHAAPTTTGSCKHPSEAPSAVALALHSFADSPTCSEGNEPLSKPAGGTGSKKRHSAPMGQTPCGPGQPSPASPPLIISVGIPGMGVPPGETLSNLGPTGGSGGKHRHSPPTKPDGGPTPGQNGESTSTPEPGSLLLLATGLLVLAAIPRRGLRLRTNPPTR
jgi:hypothetical protein